MQGFLLPQADKNCCPLFLSVLALFQNFPPCPVQLLPLWALTDALWQILQGHPRPVHCTVPVPGYAAPVAAVGKENVCLFLQCLDQEPKQLGQTQAVGTLTGINDKGKKNASKIIINLLKSCLVLIGSVLCPFLYLWPSVTSFAACMPLTQQVRNVNLKW